MKSGQAKNAMIILGAGGHSAVVIEIARACGFEPVAIYDDSAGTLGKTVAGVRVKGVLSANSLKRKAFDQYSASINFFGGICYDSNLERSA